jgi:thioredoxin 1
MLEVTSKSFEQEVLKSETAVVADFWAPWCVPCKMMEPVLEKLSSAHDGKIKFVKINVDDESELAVQFNIVSIPSLLLFDEGEMKKMHVGAASQSVLESFLKEYI